MSRRGFKNAGLLPLIAVVACFVWSLPGRTQQNAPSTSPKPGEWRYTYGDLLSTRYSSLDQINKNNVKDLKVAWRWKSDNFSAPPEYKNENTPIMVNGVLYMAAGSQRTVVAIDAATGRTLWTWSLEEGERAQKSPRRTSGRGVSYWTDGKQERIFDVTIGFRLVALNAKTGLPVASFGSNGLIDLMDELGQPGDHVAEIANTSPPVVVNDVVIIPPSAEDFTTRSMKHTRSDVMAFDARTGKKLWTFHTIPQKGEFGNDTWQNDSWTYTGHAGVWAPISVDPELGYAYLPVETPTNDYYGGHRLGNGLFGNSLVCIDVKTGKRIWHYQLTHHDIWNYDLPSAPILANINVNGKPVKAVVQLTKQAYAYVFDRVTGKPVWPIEERPAPESDVPGEIASATQPHPTKPPAYDRQAPITENDVIDFTPELKAQALQVLKQYRNGPLFSPASLAMPNGTKGTIYLPAGQGGSLWEGGAFDPETGILYAGSRTNLGALVLAKDPNSDMRYSQMREGGGDLVVHGVPILKPPYGRITAMDLNKGEQLWMIPNGETPKQISSLPSLNDVHLPKTGSPSHATLLVTKTLLFAGEGWGGQPMFRAYDKTTGAIVWETKIPGVATGQPMTYMLNGKQYIAFTAGDQDTDHPAELIVFTLADRPAPSPAQSQSSTDTASRAPSGASGTDNTLTPAEAAAGWISLFDGRTLAGWEPTGQAQWRIEDGAISVNAGPSSGGFLKTTGVFSNYELKADFFYDKTSNSGIFLRCPTSSLNTGAFTCYEVNIFDGSDMYPTGSITWFQSTMPDNKIEGPGKWNTFEITADGTHLVVKMNGKITADTRDDKLSSGTIALQAAGNGVIRFRNFKIRPIGSARSLER